MFLLLGTVGLWCSVEPPNFIHDLRFSAPETLREMNSSLLLHMCSDLLCAAVISPAECSHWVICARIFIFVISALEWHPGKQHNSFSFCLMLWHKLHFDNEIMTSANHYFFFLVGILCYLISTFFFFFVFLGLTLSIWKFPG